MIDRQKYKFYYNFVIKMSLLNQEEQIQAEILAKIGETAGVAGF